VVDHLARHISSMGVEVEIVSVGQDPMPPPPGTGLTNVVPLSVTKAWRWNPQLNARIKAAAEQRGPSLLHLHGAWLASQWYGARVARRLSIPAVLSLHGQLGPYHWTDKGVFQLLKKKFYWSVMAYPAFRSVQVIHAITFREREYLKVFFKDHPIILIPNAADLDEIDDALRSLFPRPQRQPLIAFLGRFHSGKGAHILIEAFERADLNSDWRLVLAGPAGTSTYMSHLARLVTTCKKRDRIHFVGEISGAKKWQLYQTATVVAVPSLSEVMGMVNLESAACGTPTITTHETGLEDWEDAGGVLVRPDPGELASALERISRLSGDDYRARSIAARRLIENRYSWKVVRRQWLDLYASLVR